MRDKKFRGLFAAEQDRKEKRGRSVLGGFVDLGLVR